MHISSKSSFKCKFANLLFASNFCDICEKFKFSTQQILDNQCNLISLNISHWISVYIVWCFDDVTVQIHHAIFIVTKSKLEFLSTLNLKCFLNEWNIEKTKNQKFIKQIVQKCDLKLCNQSISMIETRVFDKSHRNLMREKNLRICI